MPSIGDIFSAIKDAATKLITSGGNVGEVISQTTQRAAGSQPTPGIAPSALSPSTTDTITAEATHPGADFSAIGGAITSVTDFLQFIAWIFHPLNLLRAVEFLTGLLLFWMGLRPYLDRSGRYLGGSGASRVIRSTLASTPAGRTMRVSQGRRMGRREGQREAARMESRQQVTRSQRESSARERVDIQRRARQSQ